MRSRLTARGLTWMGRIFALLTSSGDRQSSLLGMRRGQGGRMARIFTPFLTFPQRGKGLLPHPLPLWIPACAVRRGGKGFHGNELYF